MEDKITWCFKIKEGLKIIEPNEDIANKYLEEAKSSLLRAQKSFEEKDLLWSTVIIYYSEYYVLYSFLQKIGVKCENHSCSIELAKKLLGKELINTINKHKDKKITS